MHVATRKQVWFGLRAASRDDHGVSLLQRCRCFYEGVGHLVALVNPLPLPLPEAMALGALSQLLAQLGAPPGLAEGRQIVGTRLLTFSQREMTEHRIGNQQEWLTTRRGVGCVTPSPR